MAVWNSVKCDVSAKGAAGLLVPSAWCQSATKRLFDLVGASVLLILVAPVMVIASIAVKLSSTGPVIFRHRRCGRNGRCFDVLKFRTMYSSGTGPSVTRSGDSRVTNVGRILRAWKIDELPQLVNVIRGEMSLVGPRPDVAEFFEKTTEEARRVLVVRPGITGWASVKFRNEEELLAGVAPEQLQEFYTGVLLPKKAALDLEYAAGASLRSDIGVLVRTVTAVLPIRSSDVSSGD